MHKLAIALALTSSSTAFALSSYQLDVPNGSVFRCSTCHESSGGGEGWNDFGKDILVAGGANPDANPDNQNDGFAGTPADYWELVCGDDSDGDGATNGEELGDPDCIWAAGDDDPAIDPSNPGDATSVPGDTGGGGDGGGDIAGGCASTGAGAPAVVALLAVALRRRGRR